MTMIQQENIDILGTFSSNRLDLEASLSDVLSETVTSTIFRDLGDGPQHGSIRLANPIKDRLSSFEDSQELACFRETSALLISHMNHQRGSSSPSPYHHDSNISTPPLVLKPLGNSRVNYASSNSGATASTTRSANSLIAAAPHIDFARYFQDFSSVAIVSEPLHVGDDDFSLCSETNSILTSERDDNDSLLDLYQGSFSWESHDE